MPARRRPPLDPRPEAGQLLDQGRPRAAAQVYRTAIKRGWQPLTAEEEQLILRLFTSD